VCIEALREHQRRQQKERSEALVWLDEWDLVFTTGVGTPIEPRNLLRHFQQVCVRAGLPRFQFHDLRHSCASLLLAQGVEPAVIMKMLGHSVINTTMQYAHVVPVLLREAAEKMDELLDMQTEPSAQGRTRGSKSAIRNDDDGCD